ncbi:hypothetical protein ACFL2Q_04680 [Thermodesulfobacteriota bacterium]
MAGNAAEKPSSIGDAWTTTCHHVDGTAIGAFVGEFVDRGVLHSLKKIREPLCVDLLAHEAKARRGLFHVAMRLLAHQGFVRLYGDIPAGETSVALTDHGRSWLQLAHYYKQVPFVADFAVELLEALRTGKDGDQCDWRMPEVPPRSDEVDLHRRVALHLYGWLVAVVMKELLTQRILKKLGSGMDPCVSLRDRGWAPHAVRFIGEILHAQGWVERTSPDLVFTRAGLLAASLAVQYCYPVSYLACFRSMPSALFGTRDSSSSYPSGMDETHVDRLLDVQFSGLVFEHRCKEPFLELALPLFDHEPVTEQPACIVDTGSGDGTLLVALYRAIRERTLRGRMLRTHPLKLVAAEYTRIAMEATKQALQGLGVAHLVVFGDIGDPSGLSRKLVEHGIDPLDVLHVNKSVIHNRRYRPPADTRRRDELQPVSRAPFVSIDGGLIPARDLECNLVQLFEAWTPFIRRHGMLTIEAHTVDPRIVSKTIGANLVTSLDATHGFSCQYLVEYEVFLRAAQVAGYHCLGRRLLSGWLPNHPTLAIHHFKP